MNATESLTGAETRPCPDAHHDTPHQQRRDQQGWYCPHERDEQMARAYRAREAAELAAQAERARQAVKEKAMLVLDRHQPHPQGDHILCGCSNIQPDPTIWAHHAARMLFEAGLLVSALPDETP